MNSMKPGEWGILILLSVFWGASFFFVEIALNDFKPFTLVFFRLSIAALILICIVYITGQRMPLSLKMWGAFFILGAFNNAIPFSLISWGQTRIESGIASVLNATTPIFTIILAHFFTHDERMTISKFSGIILGFIGVYFMIKPDVKNGFTLEGLGALAVITASACYGIAGIFGKRFKNISPVVCAAGMLTCSSVIMFPAAFFTDSFIHLKPSVNGITALLFLGSVSTAAAYSLYFRVLASAGAVNVMLVTFLIPVSGLCLGIGILKETIHFWECIGIGFIFSGLAIIDRRIVKVFSRKPSKKSRYPS